MRLDRTFLALNLIFMLICVIAHEIAAGQFFYLTLAVVVCGLVWRGESRGRPIYLSNGISTLLCLVAFIVSIMRTLGSSGMRGIQALDIQVPTVGQFLIAFQCIYLLRKRSPRDHVWIYLVTVVLMGTTGMLMPGLEYAPFFIVYALLGSATLYCFTAWSEALRAGVDPGEIRVTRPMLFSAVPMTAFLMIPLAVIFIMLPRHDEPTFLTRRLQRTASPQAVTGYSDTTELGHVGAIVENHDIVMRIEAEDADTGESYSAGPLLLRGASYTTYQMFRGRWRWSISEAGSEQWEPIGMNGGSVAKYSAMHFKGFDDQPYVRRKYTITQEPIQTRRLFTPFCPESLSLGYGKILRFNPASHDAAVSPRGTKTLKYTVIARHHTLTPPAVGAPKQPLDRNVRRSYLRVPRQIAKRVRDLAKTIAPNKDYPTRYAKAQRIMAYLSNSDEFAYTLNLNRTGDMEPIEDFLFERKRGHCEYFASSMVILLRCVGIPARLVNGYKVTQYNPLSGNFVVRQSDAHAWAEAYLDRAGGWRTFDPSVMRDEAMPQPVFVSRWSRNILDVIDNLWAKYILSYDSEQQEGVYGFLRRLVAKAQNFALKAAAFSERRLHSLRAFLINWGWAIGALAFIITTGIWLLKLSRRKPRALAPEIEAAIRFYTTMEFILRRHGHRRPASMTPEEYLAHLTDLGWPAPEPLARITHAFCAVRYGNQTLTPDEVRQINDALVALRAVGRDSTRRTA
jgi:protein-glutamine gamma-glutamyltransferase